MHKTHTKYHIGSNALQIEPLPPLSGTVSVRLGQASMGKHSIPAQALVM
jgi:hypothetical protein